MPIASSLGREEPHHTAGRDGRECVHQRVDEVTVNGAVYKGANIVLATGSQARSLPGLHLDGERIITSYEALRLDRVPKSAIILGGGVIGVEFASVWRSFGAEVTIVEALPHLVPAEEETAGR